jgi:hypothetical protein
MELGAFKKACLIGGYLLVLMALIKGKDLNKNK